MSVVPFRWQGSARLEQLRALLSSRAHECLRGWAGPDAELHFDPLGKDEPDADDRWYELRTKSGTLSIGLRSGSWERLGCRLADAPASDAVGIAEGIGRRATTDLLRSMVGAAALECELVESVEPGARSLDARFGVAKFRCRAMGLQASIVLDAGLCDALASRPQTTSGGLAQRSEAILPTGVVLEAFLDLGRASLEQTVDLRPGDVIKTNIALDAVIQLKSASGGTVVSGVLVSSEGQRALRCSNAIHE